MKRNSQYQEFDGKNKIASLEEIDLSLSYSYANYLTWLFDDRVELIKGKVYKMSAPARYHQQVSGSVYYFLFHYLRNSTCKVYAAPFDVRFFKESKADRDIYTVLQPDICVICDLAKLDDKGCIGSPDIVVEILSPGNNRKELFNKYKVYEEFGVKEYWVVSPGEKTLLKYTLNEECKYHASRLFELSEKVSSDVLPGFELDLDEVFRE